MFTLISEDGDQKFPGAIDVKVLYTLKDNQLSQIYTASNATKPTPVNITNHSYFNLDGHNHPTGVLDHQLQIKAGAYTQANVEHIPTKILHKFESNEDSMSFMEPKTIKTALLDLFKADDVGYVTIKRFSQDELDQVLARSGKPNDVVFGFDANYVLDNFDGNVRHVATITGSSGRIMEVHTDQPGVQLYTGNYIDSIKGKGGAEYLQRQGVCLET